MSTRSRAIAALLVLSLFGAACSSSGGSEDTDDPTGPSSPVTSETADVPTSPDVVPPAEDGPDSALAALQELCTVPTPGGSSSVPAEGPTPPAIAQVMEELEQIRGFGFEEPVVADPATHEELAAGYAEAVEMSLPEEYYARKTAAWRTIGVIPPDASIRDALLEFGSTQVIGYYNPTTGELKFIGEEAPSPFDRVTLAHELTHAIDDQRFGLERMDTLGAECRDEELEAEFALVEGNASFFMLRWAQSFLTPAEQLEVGVEAAAQEPPPGDIPPFISALLEWRYIDGMEFVTRLESQGGVEAIDAAFESPPVSTEQIMHPERYPNDLPVPVDVPDLASELGEGWADLDVQGVGESWLNIALGLYLDGEEAAAAAAGWDGGIYRAWSLGDDVAVVLATAWDTEADAEEFAAAMTSWIEASGRPAMVLPVEGSTVRVLFGSDADNLALLEAAAG